MIIGSLQLNVIKGDKEKNLNTVERLVDRKVDLVVLPELFSTGYFYDSADKLSAIAEEIPNGYTTKRLAEIARKANCCFVGAIVEKEADKLYITAIITGPAGYIGKHRKRNLTDHELRFFSRGDSTAVYDIKGCKVGVLICFEGWFPEGARELMLKGAQVICHSLLTSQQRTIDIMRVRAIENKAYLVLANSISTESFYNQAVTFRGDSRIIDYEGNILVNAGQTEGLVTAEINADKTAIKDLEDCADLIAEVNGRIRFI